MPPDLMECFEAKQVPRLSLRPTMIRIIADDIVRKTANPSKHLVDQVAAKVTRMYPESLLDKIDDLIIGHSGLTKQIYSRIENEEQTE